MAIRNLMEDIITFVVKEVIQNESGVAPSEIYEQDIIATPEIKYIRRQVLHNAQDFLLNLYGGYTSK